MSRFVYMPRARRLVLANVGLHIVQRGRNREPCFFSHSDYAHYLRLLARFSNEYGCSVHAYCLMTNHVHLFLTPHETGACAQVMKQLNQCYVQGLNRSTGRSGTIWGGRFHSSVVSSSAYALACYRYIELNPIRAGMVAHPSEYRWSSHRANAGEHADALLAAHPTYLALSESAPERSAAYRALFDVDQPAPEVEAIRLATRGGYCIGEPRKPRGRRPRNQQA